MANACSDVSGGFAFPNCQGQLVVDVTAAGVPTPTGNVTLELSGGKLGDTPVPMGTVRHPCPQELCFFFLDDMECSVPCLLSAEQITTSKTRCFTGPKCPFRCKISLGRIQVGLHVAAPRHPDDLENNFMMRQYYIDFVPTSYCKSCMRSFPTYGSSAGMEAAVRYKNLTHNGMCIGGPVEWRGAIHSGVIEGEKRCPQHACLEADIKED